MDWEFFTNGKFKILPPKWKEPVPLIDWYVNRDGEFCLQWYDAVGKLVSSLAEECTLVARKVEDITDEEVFILFEDAKREEKHLPDYRSHLEDMVKNNTLNKNQFYCLISMLIYPFPQYHFKDGTVVDIKTLTETSI